MALTALGLLGAAACGGESEPGSMARYERGRAVVERALTVMGGPAELREVGTVLVEAEGTLDKAAEGQGYRPGEPSPGPFRESFALDLAGERVALEYREERFDGTFEGLREAYVEDADHVLVIDALGIGLTLRSPENEAERARLYRRFPQLLLAEVLRRPASLRWLGDAAGEVRVSASLETGETVTLGFAGDSGVLRSVEYLMELEGEGDTVVRWRYGGYEPVPGLGLFPRRYGMTVNGRPYTDLRVARVETGAGEELFGIPAGVRALPPRDVPPTSDEAPAELVAEELEPGVYLVPSVRSGFRPMFVELDSFVVAVDAPAGFPLLSRIPAGRTDPGPSSSWVSERYVDVIRRTVPDKPIRYVVLTHFHADHAAGVRAFVAEGATVLAAPSAVEAVRRVAALEPTLGPDRLTRSSREARVEAVEGRRAIGEGEREVRILDMGENPHHDGMLVVHLPALDLMFVSDMLTPTRLEQYPRDSHAALDSAFVAWLDAKGLSPSRIYTMHGSGHITPEHLDRVRRRTP